VNDEVRSASGYAVGSDSGPDYQYVLSNPVKILRKDQNGRTVDEIEAVRLAPAPGGVDDERTHHAPRDGSSITAERDEYGKHADTPVETAGRLSPSDLSWG
jgi:hypothetical protein